MEGCFPDRQVAANNHVAVENIDCGYFNFATSDIGQ